MILTFFKINHIKKEKVVESLKFFGQFSQNLPKDFRVDIFGLEIYFHFFIVLIHIYQSHVIQYSQLPFIIHYRYYIALKYSLVWDLCPSIITKLILSILSKPSLFRSSINKQTWQSFTHVFVQAAEIERMLVENKNKSNKLILPTICGFDLICSG